MAQTTFTITRPDGRSNGQVVIDLVKDGAAGHTYTYEEIGAALSAGTGRDYSTHDVQSIVTRVFPRLLKEQARALHCVRGVGYRLAPGAYHMTLANDRHSRADKQMLRGVQTLQHVRWDEMDTNHRLAHEGQLLLTSALYSQMRLLETRQRSVEDSIKKMLSRNIAAEGE